jgi:hypothetical protein
MLQGNESGENVRAVLSTKIITTLQPLLRYQITIAFQEGDEVRIDHKTVYHKRLRQKFQLLEGHGEGDDVKLQGISGRCGEIIDLARHGLFIGDDKDKSDKDKSGAHLNGVCFENCEQDTVRSHNLAKVQLLICSCIMSMLEHDSQNDVVALILKDLDLHMLGERANAMYIQQRELETRAKRGQGVKEELETVRRAGAHLYLMIRKLSDLEAMGRGKVRSSTVAGINSHVKAYFDELTGDVELVIGGKLHREYFVFDAKCRHLTEKTRDKFLLSVDRETCTAAAPEPMLHTAQRATFVRNSRQL